MFWGSEWAAHLLESIGKAERVSWQMSNTQLIRYVSWTRNTCIRHTQEMHGNSQDIRSKKLKQSPDICPTLFWSRKPNWAKKSFFFNKNTMFLADLFFFVKAPFAENVFSWICFRISGVLPLYGKQFTKGSLSNRGDFPFLL